jgi:hypothetical protein
MNKTKINYVKKKYQSIPLGMINLSDLSKDVETDLFDDVRFNFSSLHKNTNALPS